MATLKITEDNKLEVVNYKKDVYVLNGEETDSLELIFNVSNTIVETALRDLNKKENAALIINSDSIIDLTNYIYIRITKTMLKGVDSYTYLLVKDNTTDVEIKDLKDQIKILKEDNKTLKARNEYYGMMLGVDE